MSDPVSPEVTTTKAKVVKPGILKCLHCGFTFRDGDVHHCLQQELDQLRQQLAEAREKRIESAISVAQEIDEKIRQGYIGQIQEQRERAEAAEAKATEAEAERDRLVEAIANGLQDVLSWSNEEICKLARRSVQQHEALTTALLALEQEMRTMAMVAGQSSVESLDTDAAAADAHFAEYCATWADRLSALLASPSAGTRTTND